MAIDPYDLCPCGSGKKVKFCCADLVGDIEKIHRMIQGDQPRAALRHVEQTLAEHPDRASLLDLRVILELSLEDLEAARATVQRFVTTHPHSPTARAGQAILLANTEGGRAAIVPLQQAIELLDRDMPQRVLEAIGSVGHALLLQGHVLAAQAHLWMYAAIAPKDDTRAFELLARLNQVGDLPLLLRDQLKLRDAPAGAAWKDDADRAKRMAVQGRWRQATQAIDALGQKHGAEPMLVYNRAVVGGWLAEERALVAGLHAFAQLDVSLDDAVEAEAIAQLLDHDLVDKTFDTVRQTYAIADLDQLAERLAADPRLENYEVDPASIPENAQRPRHSFLLMDRPTPESGASIERADVPRVSGFISIYGRRTDQPERLEVIIDRDESFDAICGVLQEVAGELLGEVLEEKVIGHISATERALSWRWHFPADTPLERRRTMLADERKEAIVSRWPEVPRPALSGKSPREASSDSQMRTALMAAVLILEQGSHNYAQGDAITQLRKELGLPQPEPIDPATVDGARLPLVRIPRLSLEGVSDETLVQLYRRAAVAAASSALVHLAKEIIRRPSVNEHIPHEEAYRLLATLERDPAKVLQWIDEARQKAAAEGRSTANWDIAELELYITEGNAEEARRVLADIDRNHMNDPDVAAAVYRLLYAAGLIPPEGLSPGAAMHDLPTEAVANPPAEPESGRIWTPGADQGTGKKQAIWTP